jgi:hypothetical protein
LEHAKQKYSSSEEIGNAILLHLFEISPETKAIFCFESNQGNIESNTSYGTYGTHMGEAIRGTLLKILDEKHFTKDVDMAWKEIFDTLSLVIVQSMP